MPSLLSDLERILGKEAVAKIEADTTAKFRFGKAEEMISLYEDDDTDTAVTKREDPPAKKEPVAASSDLAALTSQLTEVTKKLGNVVTKEDLNKTIQDKGNELVQAAVSRALEQSDELSMVRERHREEFGEKLDSAAFKQYVSEQTKAGRRFDSITDAYEKMTATKREDARVEGRARERLKELQKDNQSSQVPGFTPPSAKSPLSVFANRSKVTDVNGGTNVDRAAAALNERLAAKSSEA